MAILFADHVRVATSTVGTGTLALGVAMTGYRTFAQAVTDGALVSGCTVYYAIQDGVNWECGTGVYTTGSPDSLTRTVNSSSSGGTALISLSGSAQVAVTMTQLSAVTATVTAGTIDNAVIGSVTPAAGTFTTATATTGNFTNLKATASLATASPLTVSATSYTLATTDTTIFYTGLSATTLTLPAPSAVTGRLLFIMNSGGSTITSASTNINPTNNVATTAILPAVSGSSIVLQSNGTYWMVVHQSTDALVGTYALTSGTTIAVNAALANVFTLTLATAATLSNPTNLVAGRHYQFVITQDSTGSRTLAYGTVYKWANKSAPTLSTAANSIDIINAYTDGTNMYCTFAPNFG